MKHLSVHVPLNIVPQVPADIRDSTAAFAASLLSDDAAMRPYSSSSFLPALMSSTSAAPAAASAAHAISNRIRDDPRGFERAFSRASSKASRMPRNNKRKSSSSASSSSFFERQWAREEETARRRKAYQNAFGQRKIIPAYLLRGIYTIVVTSDC